MCNLYQMTKTTDEVAKWFSASEATNGANLSSEVYPGYPGLVVAEGELRTMVWGFPLRLKSKKTGELLKPRPVNNARSDKLDGFMWRQSFETRRCLIPLSAWCEAEGPKGGKTRTWLSVPNAELFAVAGIWRNTDEWGPSYSMVMVDSAGDAAAVHDRMPVILSSDRCEQWTNGSTAEARMLCRGWTAALDLDKTEEPWRGG